MEPSVCAKTCFWTWKPFSKPSIYEEQGKTSSNKEHWSNEYGNFARNSAHISVQPALKRNLGPSQEYPIFE